MPDCDVSLIWMHGLAGCAAQSLVPVIDAAGHQRSKPGGNGAMVSTSYAVAFRIPGLPCVYAHDHML